MITANTPAEGRRVPARMIAALFAAIFAALGIGYYLFVQPAYVDAFTGVRPADTAALVAQLDAKGIAYRLGDGGTTIAVPAAKADAAQVAIAASDVPLHGGVGLELFNKSDMGLTDFAQKINYQRALQGELERTITMIDGITAARVHLALPERSIFRAERVPPKAAVELLTKPGTVLDGGRIVGVQRLVANAVADLVPNDVVIVDSTGRALTTSTDTEAATDPIGEQQQSLQHYYRGEVRAALASILPSTQLDVRVLTLPRAGAVARLSGGAGGHDDTRDFGLRVTVMSEAPLASDQQAQLRSVCEQAIQFNASLGDTIDFRVGVPAPGITSQAPVATASAAAAPSTMVSAPAGEQRSSWSWSLSLAIGLMLIGVATTWRLVRRFTAAARRRADLVERLRVALAESEAGYAG